MAKLWSHNRAALVALWGISGLLMLNTNAHAENAGHGESSEQSRVLRKEVQKKLSCSSPELKREFLEQRKSDIYKELRASSAPYDGWSFSSAAESRKQREAKAKSAYGEIEAIYKAMGVEAPKRLAYGNLEVEETTASAALNRLYQVDRARALSTESKVLRWRFPEKDPSELSSMGSLSALPEKVFAEDIPFSESLKHQVRLWKLQRSNREALIREHEPDEGVVSPADQIIANNLTSLIRRFDCD